MSPKIIIFLIAVLIANTLLVASEVVDYPSSAELPGALLYADFVTSETTEGWKWPWIASFYIEQHFFCAGSLIRDNFVLSGQIAQTKFVNKIISKHFLISRALLSPENESKPDEC